MGRTLKEHLRNCNECILAAGWVEKFCSDGQDVVRREIQDVCDEVENEVAAQSLRASLSKAQAAIAEKNRAVRWAWLLIQDWSDGPDRPGNPAHDCEYFTEPERGKCDFCEGWSQLERAMESDGSRLTALVEAGKHLDEFLRDEVLARSWLDCKTGPNEDLKKLLRAFRKALAAYEREGRGGKRT